MKDNQRTSHLCKPVSCLKEFTGIGVANEESGSKLWQHTCVRLFHCLLVCTFVLFSLFASPVFICFSFVSLCFVCLIAAACVLVRVCTCTIVGLELTVYKVATMGYPTSWPGKWPIKTPLGPQAPFFTFLHYMTCPFLCIMHCRHITNDSIIDYSFIWHNLAWCMCCIFGSLA